MCTLDTEMKPFHYHFELIPEEDAPVPVDVPPKVVVPRHFDFVLVKGYGVYS